jgi:hypothetical protein
MAPTAADGIQGTDGGFLCDLSPNSNLLTIVAEKG